ncbi:unnamed protein product [Vicia faba]|uniref:Reverse transcriptase domain-containing protein n=1 Tax=Vicia faba TaxID=3906 RepID=A0AAV1AJ87_VICFA|nr:unnamed protein product [Vicia faba]
MENLIMEVVNSVKMRVLWKGDKGDYFEAKKGIGQGDPLSSYLFVLYIDKLSHLIIEAVEDKRRECMKIGSKRPKMSHLMFEDNLILFGKASEAQIQIVMDILNLFCKALGQRVSMDKSNIVFFCITPATTRRQILAKFGFKETSSLETY